MGAQLIFGGSEGCKKGGQGNKNFGSKCEKSGLNRIKKFSVYLLNKHLATFVKILKVAKCLLTVVEFLMLEIQPTFFYKISPGLPFSMYIIMVRRKNALRNKITEKTEFVYFFF